MKSKIAMVFLLVATNSFAETVDIDAAMIRVNQALQIANDATQENNLDVIGEAQNLWIKSADLDCKYFIGQPKEANISMTQNPAFGTCMAEHMQSRANELLKLACQKNRAYCEKK